MHMSHCNSLMLHLVWQDLAVLINDQGVQVGGVSRGDAWEGLAESLFFCRYSQEAITWLYCRFLCHLYAASTPLDHSPPSLPFLPTSLGSNH